LKQESHDFSRVECQERPYGFYDLNEDFIIFYNDKNLVSCIKCISPYKLKIANFSLSHYSVWDLYLIVNDICEDLIFTHISFRSEELKLCITFNKKQVSEGMADMIDSVIIANKDYWTLHMDL
jgi:hypothetical protein